MQNDILILTQLSQMAAALLAGFGGGIAFDIYQRLCYGTTKRRQRPTAYIKGDLLFGIILISLWLLFWFSCTDGSLRFSVLIWLVIGFALYFGVFRRRITALIHKLPRPHKDHPKDDKTKKKPQHKKMQLVDKGSHLLVGLYQHGSSSCHAIRKKISHLRPQKEEKKQ